VSAGRRAAALALRLARSSLPAVCLAFGGLVGGSAHAAACVFPPVQQQIDAVLADPQKGEEFRRQVKSGYDSLDVMDKLFPPDQRQALDDCRYEAGEYMTRRGFPPGH
jgi:hypothetical protein